MEHLDHQDIVHDLRTERKEGGKTHSLILKGSQPAWAPDMILKGSQPAWAPDIKVVITIAKQLEYAQGIMGTQRSGIQHNLGSP